MRQLPGIIGHELTIAEKKKAWMVVFSPRRLAIKHLGVANRSTTKQMSSLLESARSFMPEGWFMRVVRYPRKTLYYAIRRIENESEDPEIYDHLDSIVPDATYRV